MSTKIMKTYNKFKPSMKIGKRALLYDENGKQYIDFVAGVAVNSMGHCHEEIIKTIETQAKKLMHVSNLYHTCEQIKLANKLTELAGMQSVFFCNSGTESVEAALKIARKYGKKFEIPKQKILYLENSFHGRTMGALSVTASGKYQEAFKPLIGETQMISVTESDLEMVLDEQVCAVIVEPIQGEGGVNQIPVDWMKKLSTLCQEKEILLIFDEVQSGVARTGKWFAFEWFDVKPDVLCLAKGLGGGFPIGATLVNEKADVLEPGDHGSTFGGNPLACAVALTVLGLIEKEKILGKIPEMEAIIHQFVDKQIQSNGQITGIKGKGLLLGIVTKCPAKELVKQAFEEGLLLIAAGDHITRIIPPLNITEMELKEGLIRLESTLEKMV